MGRGFEQTLQRRNSDGQQAYEKMLHIANYQGNEIKTTMRYYITPVRMANIQKTRTTNAGEDAEKGEPS